MKYNLKKIALFAEIASNIAIVVSLIFVGLQFKENTRVTRSATASTINSTLAAWYIGIGNNEQSSALLWDFYATPEKLSSHQKFQAILNLHSIMLIYQNSFYLSTEGTLDKQMQTSITELMHAVKDQPGWDVYWKSRKSIFLKEFQHYVDNIMDTDKIVSEGVFKLIDSTSQQK